MSQDPARVRSLWSSPIGDGLFSAGCGSTVTAGQPRSWKMRCKSSSHLALRQGRKAPVVLGCRTHTLGSAPASQGITCTASAPGLTCPSAMQVEGTQRTCVTAELFTKGAEEAGAVKKQEQGARQTTRTSLVPAKLPQLARLSKPNSRGGSVDSWGPGRREETHHVLLSSCLVFVGFFFNSFL